MSLVHDTPRMTVEDFVEWAAWQPEGRFELVDGEIVSKPAEGLIHSAVKGRLYYLLYRAAEEAGFRGCVFTDGPTVRIRGDRGREPDAFIVARRPDDLKSKFLDEPAALFEVVSPTSVGIDTGPKLQEYFGLPSLSNYLLIYPEDRLVVHHRRSSDGTIITRILTTGTLRFDPPGIAIEAEEIFVF